MCLLGMSYNVSCQGAVQLGGPDPRYNWDGPAKVGACKPFLFTESSLVVKIKNNWLIFVITLFFASLLQCSMQWQMVTINYEKYGTLS